MPITSAWTTPSALDLAVGAVLPESYWDNLVSNTLYLWDTLHNRARQANIASLAGPLTIADSLTVTKNQNTGTSVNATNSNANATAWANLTAQADTTTVQLGAMSSVYNAPYTNKVLLQATGPAGLMIQNLSNAAIQFYVNNSVAGPVIDNTGALQAAVGVANNVPVKIFSVTLGVLGTSYTVSSIPATYKHLKLVIRVRTDYANQYDTFCIRLNGDTGTNYRTQHLYAQSAGTVTGNGGTSIARGELGFIPANTATAGMAAGLDVTLFDYASSLTVHHLTSTWMGKAPNAVVGDMACGISGVEWNHTAGAINQIQVFAANGNLPVGFTLSLYGLPA